jgi:thermostable 8-oxoguanine DNA glycosylase
MKKSILFLAMGFITITANAQKMKEAEVPAAVKSSFMKLYPAAKVQAWEKENGNYEAEFTQNKVETSVLMSADGKLMETEMEIKASALPQGANDYVTKNLNGKKVKEASKITDAKGTVTYEAEVDEADYIFDSKGAFIKKVVEVDTDKDGDKKD